MPNGDLIIGEIFPGSIVGCGKTEQTISYNVPFTKMTRLCNTLVNTLLGTSQSQIQKCMFLNPAIWSTLAPSGGNLQIHNNTNNHPNTTNNHPNNTTNTHQLPANQPDDIEPPTLNPNPNPNNNLITHPPNTHICHTPKFNTPNKGRMSNPPIWVHLHLTSPQTLASLKNIPQPPQHPTNHRPTNPPAIHMGTRLLTPNFLFTPHIHSPHIQMRTAIVLKWTLTPNRDDQASRTWGHVYMKLVQQAM